MLKYLSLISQANLRTQSQTILQVNRASENSCVLRKMFCKLDVRCKTIVTLALSYDCRKIFCKSGPSLLILTVKKNKIKTIRPLLRDTP